MFGFPVNLQDSGVQKFTNDADNGFPKIQQREVFYSVKDGLWNDPTIWQTASGRIGLLPTRNDDVYIKHNIDLNVNAETNNVFVSGLIRSFIVGSRFLYCFGNFKCVGTFDGSIGLQLVLFQNDNYINNFIPGTSKIYYAGNIDQEIMPLPYWNLQTGIFYNNIIYGRNQQTNINTIKSLKSNLIVSNGLEVIFGKFDTRGFDLIVNGITSYYGPGQGSEFVSTGSGNLLFIGEFRIGSTGFAIGMDFSEGNPNIEFRGGIDTYRIQAGAIKMGTGTITFSTNNQTIRSTAGATGNITFAGNVVLNNVNLIVDVNTSVVFNGTINATNAANTLTNKGTITFGTAASVPSMTTGIVDFTTFSNTIQYGGNYTATIPSYFPTFHNLTISGTGTKSLGVNTTLNGNLGIYGQTTAITKLECGNYNLTINGITYIGNGNNSNPATLSKSGPGNVLFVGEIQQVSDRGARIDFSGGNPSVEVRNGIRSVPLTWGSENFFSGTGTWTFSTNNQSITSGYSTAFIFYNVLISGPITLSLNNTNAGYVTMKILNTINGDNVNSKLLIGAPTATFGCQLIVTNSNTIMATGIFDYTTSNVSYIAYENTTNYSIPYSTYKGLIIYGNTGVKSLSSNTIVQSLQVYGSFDCGSFDLTNNGTTLLQSGIFKKTGAGNIYFNGAFQLQDNSCTFDLSGNPNVELKNGFLTSNLDFGYGLFKSGTGQWKFSTNNQTLGGITNGFFRNNPFDASILISGAITLTFGNPNAGSPTYFTNVINGDNANSKLLLATNSIFAYQNATQPMATGILDTSTNLNTWIYGSGNQDIKGGPTTLAKQVYRNLTLNGGGTKTLQGYVSVQNTYTLTSPATLNNNGFTLTNP